jgi:hypothetical protein
VSAEGNNDRCSLEKDVLAVTAATYGIESRRRHWLCRSMNRDRVGQVPIGARRATRVIQSERQNRRQSEPWVWAPPS